MTREETKKLLAIICSLYPNFHPDDMQATIDAWSVVLKDDKFSTLQKNLIIYSRQKHEYAPSIGQLLDISEIEPSAEEMWVEVRKAIGNSSYHAEEEFAKLSPKTQRAVGSPRMLEQWAITDYSIIDTSIAKQFKDSYKAISEREIKNNGRIEQKTSILPEISTKG